MLFLVFSHFSNAQSHDKNGKIHGKWKFYNEESKQLIFEGYYNHGIKEGVFISYHSNNKIKDENLFKNNLFNGLQKTYDEKGVLIWTCNYAKGIKHGIETYYYSNGKLKATINYSKGVIDGMQKHYSVDGQVIKFKQARKQTIHRSAKE